MSGSGTNGHVDVDLLLVGAGPTGLFGAYYAGFRGLSLAVVDALAEPGGQITAMYPEKQIYDVAGFPGVKGRDLVSGLLGQAARFNPTYLFSERAVSLARLGAGDGASRFEVATESGRRIRCGAVVITGGIGAFAPRPMPVGTGFEGRGLTYFVPDPAGYAGLDVVIAGGGDSAFDWAQTLEPIARSVTLVHRRKTFRAHAATVAQVRASSVEVITDAQVVKVAGEANLESVVIDAPGVADGGRVLPCQRLVAALGFVADLGPLRGWGLEIAHHRHILVDSAMQTSLPGVYAAGDITDYQGKVRLMAVGFGEVATAVNNAAVYLDPDAELFPGHSTDAEGATVTPSAEC